MNFEVYCFDFVNDGLEIVHKEYFETYEGALQFEKDCGKNYGYGVSITPMNELAELEMREYQHRATV